VSRGGGFVQRTIERLFTDNPSATFSVEELARQVYAATLIEKRHRVAVLRAADAVARRMWWHSERSAAPGQAVIFSNPMDVRSYAMGRLRTGISTAMRPASELQRMLDDPTCRHSHAAFVQPGGEWWNQVRAFQLERAGFHEEAEAIRAATSPTPVNCRTLTTRQSVA
jgi:hypothetical protein